jgi:phospholipase C
MKALSLATLMGHAAASPAIAQMSHIKTAFVIVMENHNWAQIKNSTSALYINHTLLPMASYAEQYYNPPGIHPSLANYLWREAGTNFGISNDADPKANHQASTSHFVTQLRDAGMSWKTYQEGITGTACPLASSSQYVPQTQSLCLLR